jgi:hypothetical protein
MNTEKLIPISFSRKITPAVAGDVIAHPLGNKYTLQAPGVELVKTGAYDEYFVVSFADRTNTGKQPVGDDVIVDMNCLCDPEKAKSISWSSEYQRDDSWKPNHAAMLKQWQAEQANPGVDFDDALKEFDAIPMPREDCSLEDIKMFNDELSKPTFTQAQSDAGELPGVGSKALLTCDGIFDKNLKEGDEVLIGGHADFGGGSVAVFCKERANNTGTGVSNMFKPIQTAEDKLRDAIYAQIATPQIGDADLIPLIDDLLAKFTIALKG